MTEFGPLEGRTISGYQIGPLLGRGGSGEVYRALQISLNREVALKILGSASQITPALLQRFQRETTLHADLVHSNLVRVYDSGMIEDRPYMALELVEGTSLKTRIQQSETHELPFIVETLIALSSVLDYLHTIGIIHRDVKPSNVMIDTTGQIKLMDLGLAKSESSSNLTDSIQVIGTMAYMPPEIVHGSKNLTSSTDVYALGLIAYQLTTGTFPYAGRTLGDWIGKIRYEIPERPSRIRPDLPILLDELIMAMLEKQPADRPSSHVVHERLRLGQTLSGPVSRASSRTLMGPKNEDRLIGRIEQLWAATQGLWSIHEVLSLLIRRLAIITILSFVASALAFVTFRARGPREDTVRAGQTTSSLPLTPMEQVWFSSKEIILTPDYIYFRARTPLPVRLELTVRAQGSPSSSLSRSESAPACWHRLDLALPNTENTAGKSPSETYRLEYRSLEGALILHENSESLRPPSREDQQVENRNILDQMALIHRKMNEKATPGHSLVSGTSSISELLKITGARQAFFWSPDGQKIVADLELSRDDQHSDLRMLITLGGSIAQPGTGPGLRIRTRLIEALSPPTHDSEGPFRMAERLAPHAAGSLMEISDPVSLAAVDEYVNTGWRTWIRPTLGVNERMARRSRLLTLQRLARTYPNRAIRLQKLLQTSSKEDDVQDAKWIEFLLPTTQPESIVECLSDPQDTLRLHAARALLASGPCNALPKAVSRWAEGAENQGEVIMIMAAWISLHRSPLAVLTLEKLLDRFDRGSFGTTQGFTKSTGKALIHGCLSSMEVPEAREILVRDLHRAGPNPPSTLMGSLVRRELERRLNLPDANPLDVDGGADGPSRPEISKPATLGPDPDGHKLLHGLLFEPKPDEAMAGAYLSRGTPYQRWAASLGLGALGSPLPTRFQDGMEIAPTQGSIADGIEPVWQNLKQILKNRNAEGQRDHKRAVFVLNPTSFGCATGWDVTAGDHITVRVAGLATPGEIPAERHGELNWGGDTGSQVLLPPKDLWIGVQVGNQQLPLADQPAPQGAQNPVPWIAPVEGRLILRAGLRNHTPFSFRFSDEGLEAYRHVGLVLAEVTVAPGAQR